MGEREDFRTEVEGLLDQADEQLADNGERGRLREAIERRHDDWFALVGGLAMQELAVAFVELLAKADQELSPAQVRELERRITERLPFYPPA